VASILSGEATGYVIPLSYFGKEPVNGFSDLLEPHPPLTFRAGNKNTERTAMKSRNSI